MTTNNADTGPAGSSLSTHHHDDEEARCNHRHFTVSGSQVALDAHDQLVAFATSWHPRCGASSPARLLWHNNNNHGGGCGGGGPWLARTIAADHCLALPSPSHPPKRFGLMLVPFVGQTGSWGDEEEGEEERYIWASLVTLGVSPGTLGVTQGPVVAGNVRITETCALCDVVVDVDTCVVWDSGTRSYFLRRFDQTRGGCYGKLLMRTCDITNKQLPFRGMHAKGKWLVWFGSKEMLVLDLHAPYPWSTRTCVDISRFPWYMSHLFSSVHWPNELGLSVHMKGLDDYSGMFIVIDIERTFATKNLEILTQVSVANPKVADEFGITALLMKKKADNTRVIVAESRIGCVFHVDSVTGDVVQLCDGGMREVSQLNTSTFCIHSRGDGERSFTQLWECGNTAAGPVRTIEHERSGGGGVNDDTLQVVGGSGFLFVVGRDTIVVSDAESGVVVVTLSLSFQKLNQTAFLFQAGSLL
ncbi:hypothetical protein Pelo_17527 [Pelomyxa schiedti]|nr:hypothetical protein Pelo_17527 [Pelomyxa schiedti]